MNRIAMVGEKLPVVPGYERKRKAACLASLLLILMGALLAPISTMAQTQQQVLNSIASNLPTNNANEISALALRNTLNYMTSAIFSSSSIGIAPPLVTSSSFGVINGQVTVSSQPSYLFPEALTTEFQGDFSHVITAEDYTVNGSTTMGQPLTGFQWSPAVTPHQGLVNYNSGWNQDTADNGGRTGFAYHRVMINHNGLGDAMPYYGFCQVENTKVGATNFLAGSACEVMAADLGSSVSGAYLEGFGDFNFSDGGNDIAAIGGVRNFNRTINTAALGEIWFGDYIHSTGISNIDAGELLTGPMNVGIDLTQITNSDAAINLSGNQKIILNSSACTIGGINWYGCNYGGSYIWHSVSDSQVEIAYNNAVRLAIGSGYVNIIGETLSQTLALTTAAPIVSSGQIGYGGTTAVSSNCGSLSGATACIVVNIAGTTHYIPYY